MTTPVRALSITAVLIAGVRFAAAQPSNDVPLDDQKDANTATMISVGGTLLGPALLAASAGLRNHALGDGIGMIGAMTMVVGPSAGHWYAGEGDGGQIGLRAGGLLVGGVIGGLGVLSEDNDGNLSPSGTRLLYIGGAVMVGTYVGSVIYDIATAGKAARRFNRSHRIDVAPTLALGDGHAATGVAFAGSF